jgi:hypothetical protein
MAHIDNSDLIFLSTVRQIEKDGNTSQLLGPMMPAEERLREKGYLKYNEIMIRTTLRGRVRNWIAQRFGK